jgi:hypothetical protein
LRTDSNARFYELHRGYNTTDNANIKGFYNASGTITADAAAVASSATSIKFKIDRTGSTFKAYYDVGAGFVQFGAAGGRDITSDDVTIYLYAESITSNPTPTVTVDNLVLNSGTIAPVTYNASALYGLNAAADLVSTESLPTALYGFTAEVTTQFRVPVNAVWAFLPAIDFLSPRVFAADAKYGVNAQVSIPIQAAARYGFKASVRPMFGYGFSFVKSFAQETEIVFRKGFGLDKETSFVKELSTAVISEIDFVKSLAFTDVGGGEIILVKSMGSGADIDFVKMLTQGGSAEISFVKTLGMWSVEAEMVFEKDLRGWIEGEIDFVKSLSTLGLTLAQSASVVIGDVDVTASVISLDMNLFSSTAIISDCTIKLKSLALPDGGDIVITLDSDKYTFKSEELSENLKTHEIEVWGRDITLVLSQPDVAQIAYNYSGDVASIVAADVAGDYDLSWQIDDYVLALLSGTASPMDIINSLAKAAGGVLRALNGTLNVGYPYVEAAPVSELPWALEMTRDRKPSTYDAVTVNFGGGAADTILIETDTPTVPVGTWAVVRVYAIGVYELTTSANAKVLDTAGVIEEVVEDILMQAAADGKGPATGKLSKPVLSVLALDGCPDAEVIGGQVISGRGCDVVSVRYTTRHDRWLVTNYIEAKKLICTAVTQNSVAVKNGAGDRVYVIDEPMIATPSAALRRAQKEMIDASGPWIVSVIIPYEAALCNPIGVNVVTPWGRGVVTAAAIKITANPLKILNTLEVMLWPEPV